MDLSRKVAGAIARVGSLVDDDMRAGPSSYELGSTCFPVHGSAYVHYYYIDTLFQVFIHNKMV